MFTYCRASGLCADVVIVKPEPVNNEGKDEFKGPEFRNKGGSKVKEESQRRRPGEALIQTCVVSISSSFLVSCFICVCLLSR